MKLREVFAFMLGLFFGLAFATIQGCGPSQHPCVTAYEKAETEAQIAEVDKTCGHMLLPSASASAGAP